MKRMLAKNEAAGYCGLKESTFSKQVAAGILPEPVKFGKYHVWDIKVLDAALDYLSGLASSYNGGVDRIRQRINGNSQNALR